MIRVTTKGKGNGLVQVFGGLDTGPESVIGSAWVYVVHGAVSIGTGNGGKTRLDMQSTSSGSWELLSARNGVSPANQFMIYSASDGAIFYVAYAEVIEIPGP
jgi:hypothetical protein